MQAELSFPHASYLVQDVRMADIRLAWLVYLPCLRYDVLRGYCAFASKQAVSITLFGPRPNNKESCPFIRSKVCRGVYTAFYRYIIREVAAGRRVTGKTTLTLNHILQFTCGADKEPVLEFSIPPEIIFVSSSGYFLPSSNSCTNTLNLPCPSTASLPSDNVLFNLYEHAFGSTHFGIV